MNIQLESITIRKSDIFLDLVVDKILISFSSPKSRQEIATTDHNHINFITSDVWF